MLREREREGERVRRCKGRIILEFLLFYFSDGVGGYYERHGLSSENQKKKKDCAPGHAGARAKRLTAAVSRCVTAVYTAGNEGCAARVVYAVYAAKW